MKKSPEVERILRKVRRNSCSQIGTVNRISPPLAITIYLCSSIVFSMVLFVFFGSTTERVVVVERPAIVEKGAQGKTDVVKRDNQIAKIKEECSIVKLKEKPIKSNVDSIVSRIPKIDPRVKRAAEKSAYLQRRIKRQFQRDMNRFGILSVNSDVSSHALLRELIRVLHCPEQNHVYTIRELKRKQVWLTDLLRRSSGTMAERYIATTLEDIMNYTDEMSNL